MGELISRSKEDEKSLDDDVVVRPGLLKVIVFEASELVNKDMIGQSDPFVKIKFAEQEFKSSKVRNTLSPEWNFVANLNIESSSTNSDIVIEVYDDDYGKEEFMGSYRMPEKEATWHELSDKAGKISFSTFYIPNEQPPKEEIRGQETPQIEKVVEPLADTKEVEQIHSDEEDRKKETNDEAVESKDSKPELTKEQKENDHKDDISDNEKVKE